MKTAEEILKMSKRELEGYYDDNIDCPNSIDCIGCFRCPWAIRCTRCSACYYCEDCCDCTECNDCYECIKSSECCDCIKCYNCFNCTDCYLCSHAENLRYAICNVEVGEEAYKKKMEDLGISKYKNHENKKTKSQDLPPVS